MKRVAVAGFLAAMLGAPDPLVAAQPAPAAVLKAPAPAEIASLTHSFGPRDPADESAPDVELLLEERPGMVRRGGASGKELFDGADYSSVGELAVTRELLLGPSNPPVTLPAGVYDCDLLPGEPGRLRLVLRGEDGQRLSLPLGEIPDDGARITRATASAFEQPGDAWVVAIRLPTAAGALVLTPSGSAASAPPRTRTEAIRKGLRDRLIHGSRPVRRVPR